MRFPIAQPLSILMGVSLAHGMHLAPRNDNQDFAILSMNGADEYAGYPLRVPLDGTPVQTNNSLSITSVSSTFDVPENCHLECVDAPPVFVKPPYAENIWQVGPPQTVTSVSCTKPQINRRALENNNKSTMHLEFYGSNDWRDLWDVLYIIDAWSSYEFDVPVNGNFVIPNDQRHLQNMRVQLLWSDARWDLSKVCTVKSAGKKAAQPSLELGGNSKFGSFYTLNPISKVQSISCNYTSTQGN